MANALGIHRNHRLINEATQVGVEFRHDLPLLRFGGDVDHFNVRMRSEQPHGLRSPIARSSNDACLDLVHELSPQWHPVPCLSVGNRINHLSVESPTSVWQGIIACPGATICCARREREQAGGYNTLLPDHEYPGLQGVCSLP